MIFLTLSREPFGIVALEDAIAVARFLIEDNSEDWVQFDENKSNSITIIKSVFNHLIKNYTLFDEVETNNLMSELSHVY